jgi:hypothetical protein
MILKPLNLIRVRRAKRINSIAPPSDSLITLLGTSRLNRLRAEGQVNRSTIVSGFAQQRQQHQQRIGGIQNCGLCSPFAPFRLRKFWTGLAEHPSEPHEVSLSRDTSGRDQKSPARLPDEFVQRAAQAIGNSVFIGDLSWLTALPQRWESTTVVSARRNSYHHGSLQKSHQLWQTENQ